LEGMDPVDIPMSDIDLAIKNTIMMSPQKAVPLLCGSSLKNKGV
jgi:hypothetical protein